MNYVVCTIYKARTIAIKVFDFVSASNCVLQLTLIPLLPALNGKISQLTLGIVPWSFRQDDIPGEGGAGADQRPAVSCHEHFIGGTRTVNSFICHIAQSMKSIPSLAPAFLWKQWIPKNKRWLPTMGRCLSKIKHKMTRCLPGRARVGYGQQRAQQNRLCHSLLPSLGHHRVYFILLARAFSQYFR